MHEQTLLKVTSASVTSSKHPRHQEDKLCCWSVHSNNASSLPQTPANHSPLWTVQTQSHHTFFFLNIVKSNTSPSCTRSNCQTMFGIFPSFVLLVDGSQERKTKDINGFLLKCKRVSTFSFISHFRTTDRLHICLYMSRRTFI